MYVLTDNVPININEFVLKIIMIIYNNSQFIHIIYYK